MKYINQLISKDIQLWLQPTSQADPLIDRLPTNMFLIQNSPSKTLLILLLQLQFLHPVLVLDGLRLSLVRMELDLSLPIQMTTPAIGYALDRIPVVLGRQPEC